ncbi:hypothetical protein ABKP09_06400 [Peribacillus frigoritolerans]
MNELAIVTALGIDKLGVYQFEDLEVNVTVKAEICHLGTITESFQKEVEE